MGRRRIELQIRAVLVTFRAENKGRGRAMMDGFRARAHVLLDDLEVAVGEWPDLQARIREARQEIDHDLD
jgi:hypothetical protein